MGLLNIYAHIPRSMVRKKVYEATGVISYNITTANLRKALHMKGLSRDIKCKLYDILLYRKRRNRAARTS